MKCPEKASPQRKKLDCQRLERVAWGVTPNRRRVSLGVDGNILKLESGDAYTTLRIY